MLRVLGCKCSEVKNYTSGKIVIECIFMYNAVYCKRRTFLELAFEIGISVSSPCRLKCFEASKTQIVHWSYDNPRQVRAYKCFLTFQVWI